MKEEGGEESGRGGGAGSACLVLLHQRERAVQRQDDPALRVRGVHLARLLDGADLGHAAEEEQHVAALLGRVALVYALKHPQVRPRVQLLQPRRLLLGGDGLVDHLGGVWGRGRS